MSDPAHTPDELEALLSLLSLGDGLPRLEDPLAAAALSGGSGTGDLAASTPGLADVDPEAAKRRAALEQGWDAPVNWEADRDLGTLRPAIDASDLPAALARQRSGGGAGPEGSATPPEEGAAASSGGGDSTVPDPVLAEMALAWERFLREARRREANPGKAGVPVGVEGGAILSPLAVVEGRTAAGMEDVAGASSGGDMEGDGEEEEDEEEDDEDDEEEEADSADEDADEDEVARFNATRLAAISRSLLASTSASGASGDAAAGAAAAGPTTEAAAAASDGGGPGPRTLVLTPADQRAYYDLLHGALVAPVPTADSAAGLAGRKRRREVGASRDGTAASGAVGPPRSQPQ